MRVEIGAKYVSAAGTVVTIIGKLPSDRIQYPYVAIVMLQSGNTFTEHYNEKGVSKSFRLNLQSVLSEAS